MPHQSSSTSLVHRDIPDLLKKRNHMNRQDRKRSKEKLGELVIKNPKENATSDPKGKCGGNKPTNGDVRVEGHVVFDISKTLKEEREKEDKKTPAISENSCSGPRLPHSWFWHIPLPLFGKDGRPGDLSRHPKTPLTQLIDRTWE